MTDSKAHQRRRRSVSTRFRSGRGTRSDEASGRGPGQGSEARICAVVRGRPEVHQGTNGRRKMAVDFIDKELRSGTLRVSGETKAGSAEKQPARDNQTGRDELLTGRPLLASPFPFDSSERPHASTKSRGVGQSPTPRQSSSCLFRTFQRHYSLVGQSKLVKLTHYLTRRATKEV